MPHLVNPTPNYAGLDVWRTALQAHAAAEGRLSGIAPVPQPHPFQGHAPPPPTHGRNVPGN